MRTNSEQGHSPEFSSGGRERVSRHAKVMRYESSHQAMGTMFSVVAYAPPSARVHRSIDQAFREIDRLEAMMSHYRPDSEIGMVNREASGRPVAVSAELFEILCTAIEISRETAGAFDITVGPLMKAWGFFRGVGRLPGEQELAATMKSVGYRHVRLNRRRRTVRFDTGGVELDLGAIGKGYAVDRLAALLREEGVGAALISSGTSSIYALGAPPGLEGWEISLCDPLDRRRQSGTLRLRNLSVSFSGDYEKLFVVKGRSYAHLVDPRSGQPVADTRMSVVIAETNTTSDALSTAFFAAGSDAARAYVGKHPGLRVILFQRGGSAGEMERVDLASSRWGEGPTSSRTEMDSDIVVPASMPLPGTT